MNRQTTADLQVSENALCDVLIVDLCQMFVQTHRMYNTSVCMHAKSFWSCMTPCNPIDCSSPGSSVHGILQAIILECVVMPSSRGSS